MKPHTVPNRAAGDHSNVECGDHLAGDDPRRIQEDVVDVAAPEDAQHALVHRHDGVIRAPKLVDHLAAQLRSPHSNDSEGVGTALPSLRDDRKAFVGWGVPFLSVASDGLATFADRSYQWLTQG